MYVNTQRQLPNSDIIHGFLWACHRNEWEPLLILPSLYDISEVGERKQHHSRKKRKSIYQLEYGQMSLRADGFKTRILRQQLPDCVILKGLPLIGILDEMLL